MPMDIDSSLHPDLDEAVRRLVEKFQPERIYLFGSRARGDAVSESDYDVLMVVPASDQPHYVRSASAQEVIDDLSVPVEVIVFTREQFDRQTLAAASLASTVSREGRLLYAA